MIWIIVGALAIAYLFTWSLLAAAKREPPKPDTFVTNGATCSRIDRVIRLEDAARLYRFISGHATGADHRVTRACELEGLMYGRTLDEFCERNRLVVYEAVLR